MHILGRMRQPIGTTDTISYSDAYDDLPDTEPVIITSPMRQIPTPPEAPQNSESSSHTSEEAAILHTYARRFRVPWGSTPSKKNRIAPSDISSQLTTFPMQASQDEAEWDDQILDNTTSESVNEPAEIITDHDTDTRPTTSQKPATPPIVVACDPGVSILQEQTDSSSIPQLKRIHTSTRSMRRPFNPLKPLRSSSVPEASIEPKIYLPVIVTARISQLQRELAVFPKSTRRHYPHYL